MKNMMIASVAAAALLAACHAPHTAVGQGTGEADRSNREQSDYAAYRACLDKMATALEPDATARADEILAGLLNDHMADQNSYKLDLQRWGDFLQIAVARGDQKYATAVNLGLAREIREVDGHPPDGEGVMSFLIDSAEKDQGCKSSPYSGVMVSYPSGNVLLKLSVPVAPKTRQTFESIQNVACYSSSTSTTTSINGFAVMGNGGVSCGQLYVGSSYYGDNGKFQRSTAPKFPRIAEDDRITFSNVGTLYAPAGLGKRALEAVLTEIKNLQP